jgi:hypothetical protein
MPLRSALTPKGSSCVRYRTIGYRNSYTPMELKRIIMEVKF